MRILVGGIGHESNTFTPFKMELADFHPKYGAETLAPPLRHGAFGGIVETLQAAGHAPVPSVTAHAMPGGVVKQEVFEHLKDALLDAAHDVDAACIFLHGAMRAEDEDYCDTVVVRELRARLGPDVPLTVALDMHGNVTQEMVEAADALVAYHRAPHTDAYETGVKTAEMLLQILRGEIMPEMGFARIPFLLPGEMAQTARDPMKAMMGRAEALEERPEIVSTTVANSHCWADIPDTGVSFVVVTDGDAALAQTEANRLAEAFWSRREDFGVSAEAYPMAEAVDAALAAPESTVFLSDSGDNPGAGGTTDVPELLRIMLEKNATNAVVAGLWDVEAVEACVRAGVGREVALTIGGKLDTAHGTPLPVKGTVRLISDGVTYVGGVREPHRRVEHGVMVVLSVAGIDVVLTAERVSFHEPAQLRALGIEPLAYDIVALKRGYLTAPFEAISPRSILAFTPGATNCILPELEFVRVKRPIYPLDEDAAWVAGSGDFRCP
ncbi:MAG: M81 family metallopeptidase [Anaerolineae bacterium]